MKILWRVIALSLLMTAASFAQDNNNLTTVYLHPISLYVTSASDSIPTMVYVTVERPLEMNSSLILVPSVWYGDFKSTDTLSSGIIKHSDLQFNRYGLEAGYRYYPNGLRKGLYLQGTGSAYYCDLRNNFTSQTGSAYWFDALGYLGYVARLGNFSFATDFGLGWMVMAGSSEGNSTTMTKPGRWFNVDLALGWSF